MKKIILAAVLSAVSIACAEDITTVDGRTYKNATVIRVDAVRATIKHADGIAGVPIASMSSEWQERLHYNPQAAAAQVKAEQDAIAARAAARVAAQAAAQAAQAAQVKAEQDAAEASAAAKKAREAEQAAAAARASGQQVAAATGGQTITGAFGMTLGVIVNLSEFKAMESRDKTPGYAFTPVNPVSGLTRYYFRATPKTRLIYDIAAFGDYDNSETCKRQQAVLLDMLTEKYGKEDKPEGFTGGFQRGFSGRTQITHGSRAILLTRIGISNRSLQLSYVDLDLQEQAEKERIELERQKMKVDGSKL